MLKHGKKNTLLQHGTILLRINAEKMFSLLKIPKEKINDKKINNEKERVSGINKSFEEVAFALKESVKEIFDANLIFDKLRKEEKNSANKLVLEKYSTNKWNFRR